MNLCIYCRKNRSDFSTEEHFIPERLGQSHPFVLERGAVCDQCQNWASSDVDPAIWQEDTLVRTPLFWLNVAGKTGRAGTFTGSIGDTYDPANKRFRLDLAGSSKDAANALRGSTFWARGVHKMALGGHAWLRGFEAARRPELDEVARFVRQPNKNEFRPFARAVGRWLEPEVGLDVKLLSQLNVVVLQLHMVTYWVALAGEPLEVLRNVPALPGFHIICDAQRHAIHSNGRTQLMYNPVDPRLHVRVVLRPPHDPGPMTDLYEAWDLPVAQKFYMTTPLWKTEPAKPPP